MLKTLLAIAGIAATAFAFGTSGVQSAEPAIKVGAFFAATGPGSIAGAPQAKAVKLYAELAAKNPSLFGRPIELFLYDTATDPKQTLNIVKRLIDDDKVDILVGATTTGEAMAVVPLVQDVGIPFVTLGGGRVIAEPVKKWVFKVPHSELLAIELIFRHLQADKRMNVALLSGQGAFDESCRAAAKEVAAKQGLKIVASELYSAGDTDMTPQLTRIAGAGSVDAILSCGFGPSVVVAVRNYRQLGLKIPFFVHHGMASQQFLTAAGSAAEGIYMTVPAVALGGDLADNDPQKAPVNAFLADYQAKYGEPAGYFAGQARDGMFLTLDAIRRAGTLDKAKARDAIEGTKGFVGVTGIFTMTPTDHMGLDISALRLTKVSGGKWVELASKK